MQIAPVTVGMGTVQVLLAQLPAIIAAVTTMIVAMAGFRQLKASATTTAVHQVDVKDQLASIQRTSDDTHALVNSAMAVQLALTAHKARRVADLTSNPADIADAVEAEAALVRHLAKQGKVDAGISSRGTQ